MRPKDDEFPVFFPVNYAATLRKLAERAFTDSVGVSVCARLYYFNQAFVGRSCRARVRAAMMELRFLRAIQRGIKESVRPF